MPNFYNMPISSFTYDSIYGPMVPQYRPFVSDTIMFPTADVWTSALMADTMGYTANMPQLDWNWGTKWKQDWNANSNLQSATKNLVALESQIKSLMELDTLNASQKERLQSILDQIEALKERINNAQNLQAAEKEALAQEIKQLVEESIKTAQEIQKELQAAAEAEATGDTSTTDDSSTTSTSSSSHTGDTEDNTTGFDAETGRPVELGDKPEKAALRGLNGRLFNAIDGWGTDYDALKAAIITNGEINAGNIIELIDNWELYYGENQLSFDKIKNLDFTNFNDTDNSEWDQTLISRLIEDLGHYEKKEFVPVLLNALITRAEAAGVDDSKIQAYISKINNELGECCIGEKEIVKGLLGIYKEIKLQEAENAEKETEAQEAKEAEDARKKAEEEAKIQAEKEKTESEAKARFVKAMRDDLGDKELEMSNDIKYEDGIFKIEIEGITYEGRTYAQLAKKLKDDGYEPKEFLVKEQFDMAA